MESTLNAPFAQPLAGGRRERGRPSAVSALGKITAAGSVALGGLLTYMMAAVFKELIPPMAIFVVLAIGVAAAIATGKRWAPGLGAALAVLLAGLLIIPAAAEIGYGLTHPGDPMFALLVVLLPLLAVTAAAGIAATVQNYHYADTDRRAPRWIAAGLVGIAGACAGAIAVGAIPQATTAGVSPAVLASLPSLRAKGFAFEETVLHAKVGETVALRLENADPASHMFDVDELGVHAPIPVGQSGLALFKPTQPGTYTFYCTPHFDKATGEGMKGTLVVE
jgi:plastocyanin